MNDSKSLLILLLAGLLIVTLFTQNSNGVTAKVFDQTPSEKFV